MKTLTSLIAFALLFLLLPSTLVAQTTTPPSISVTRISETEIDIKTSWQEFSSVNTYALYTSTDLVTWTRSEYEYDENSICLNAEAGPEQDSTTYTCKKLGGKRFFRIDWYIPAGFVFTRNLTIGSQGPDVANLQTFLEARGFLSMPGLKKGYFGPLTEDALKELQTEAGIAPVSGLFDTITRALVNASM